MFTTRSLPRMPDDWVWKIWYALVALPWHAIRTYPPIFLIASSAAYASSQFAAHNGVFPIPFNYMQAIAFEWVYLGAIALASRKTRWFYITVGAGAFTSMLYIFLHSASVYGLLDGLPAVWLFVFAMVHAMPLTVVGVSYMVLFHIHAAATKEEEDQTAHKCPYGCGKGFKSPFAVNAHKQFCPNKP